MNLYELAHHPETWNVQTRKNLIDPFCWWLDTISTESQFEILNNGSDIEGHTDEFCFRMHLLFVYFATTPESEWPV